MHILDLSVTSDGEMISQRFFQIAWPGRKTLPNLWDLIALVLVFGLFVLLSYGSRDMLTPLEAPQTRGLSLDYWNLPYYGLRTTLRMFAAMAVSIVFTFTYATLAAKNRRAEMVLIPLLDVLQSVPILGFLSFTVTFFLSLFPGSTLGAECAAIFAIFTSQAWNMAFSVLSVAAQRPARSRRSGCGLSTHRLAEILAARDAVRHAEPDLERDDVHVRRVVLCRRLRGDFGRRRAGAASRRRLLSRACDRAASDRLRDRRDHRRGADHPCL